MQGASSSNLPYSDPEVSAVLARLMADKTLIELIGAWTHPTMMALVPPLVRALVRRGLRKRIAAVDSIAGFQGVVRDYVERLVISTLDELTISGLMIWIRVKDICFSAIIEISRVIRCF